MESAENNQLLLMIKNIEKNLSEQSITLKDIDRKLDGVNLQVTDHEARLKAVERYTQGAPKRQINWINIATIIGVMLIQLIFAIINK